LVHTILSSFMSLLWSMTILFLLMLIGAMFLCQTLQSAITDHGLPWDTREWLFRMYGTCGKSFYTMIEVTFSGGWPNYARRVAEEVNWLYAIFFSGYAMCVVFAVTRIITALFLKDTMNIAASDAELMIDQKMKEKASYVHKLDEIFSVADTSNDGMLSIDELHEILENPRARTWFQLLELEVHEIQALFNLIDNGDGCVTRQEFLQGVLRLKGQARSMDLITIIHENQRMFQACERIEKRLIAMDARELRQDHAVPAARRVAI